MTELAVYLPTEIAITPEAVVEESRIPLLPASKINSGVFHPDRLPQIPATRIDGQLADANVPDEIARGADVVELLAEHEQAPDPHPQYASDTAVSNAITAHLSAPDPHPQYTSATELAAHATGTGPGGHLPGAGLTNSHVSDDAGIAWTKISKVGAVPADVGAAASSHTHTGLVYVGSSAPNDLTLRWLDTSDRLTWFWDGSYWLSEEIFTATAGTGTASGDSGIGILVPGSSYNLFLKDFRVQSAIASSGMHDASNYWTFSLIRVSSASTPTEQSFATSALALGERFRFSTALNTHRNVSALSLLGFQVQWAKTGLPTTISRPGFTLTYRLAKP